MTASYPIENEERNLTQRSRLFLLMTLPILGALLTTATQLRLTHYPIGIGESLLALWAIIFCVYLYHTKLIIHRQEVAFASLMLLYLFFLLLGWITALSLSKWQGAEGGFHILLSAIYTSSMATFFFIALGQQPIYRTLKHLLLIIMPPITVLSLIIYFDFSIPGIELFYGVVRLIGWTTNPNQMALIVAPLPFLLIGVIQQSTQPIKHVYWLLLIPMIYIGLSTKSEALYIAWLAALPIALLPRQLSPLKITVMSLTLLSLAITLLINIDLLLNKLHYIFVFGDQGNIRLNLWKNGLEVIAQSPLFGFGPGAYSGINMPFTGSEAHNNYIDLATNAGLPITLLFMTTLISLIMRNMQQRLFWVSAALIALSIFITFHIMTRQPIFWLYLIILIKLSFTERPPSKHAKTQTT